MDSIPNNPRVGGGEGPDPLVKKNYNPLTGSEVKELIIRRALREVEAQLRSVLATDPHLTEALSFPRAIVEFRLRYDVHQWPQEENRHKQGEVWKKFQLDVLPPDVERILAGMEVPTAVRKPGAGLGGEELVVDEGQQASPETRALVEETFANRAAAIVEDLGSQVVSIPEVIVDGVVGVDPSEPGSDGTVTTGGVDLVEMAKRTQGLSEARNDVGAKITNAVAPGAQDKTSLLREGVKVKVPAPGQGAKQPIQKPKGGA